MSYNVTNKNKARIVERLKASGLRYWQIADYMGISENTVIRALRKPDDETTERYMQIIDEITK